MTLLFVMTGVTSDGLDVYLAKNEDLSDYWTPDVTLVHFFKLKHEAILMLDREDTDSFFAKMFKTAPEFVPETIIIKRASIEFVDEPITADEVADAKEFLKNLHQ